MLGRGTEEAGRGISGVLHLMQIKASEFEAVAEKLRTGQRARAEHCGMGQPMLVSNGRAGYAAYCFRCGGRGFIPHALSLAERIAQFKDAEQADKEARLSLRLPEPRVVDPQQWPSHARVWLYKGGFSNDDIERLGFYYHEKMQRVVMPVYDNGRLVYWQARGFVKELAKYLNPSVDRTKLVAKYGGPSRHIVLTEDILSAFKVSKVTEAWALMGTTLHDSVLADLIRRDAVVLYMGDPDAGGDKGWVGVVGRCRAVGLPCYDVRMSADPKRLSVADIREHLLNFMED